MSFAIDINTGFVGMGERFLNELLLCDLFKISQPRISLLIEVIQGAFANRNLQLIGKILPNTIVGQQLMLGQINRMSFLAVSILHRFCDAFREGRYITITLVIL